MSGCGSDVEARAEKVMAANPAEWDDGASPVPVTSADPQWGSRFAPATIVVYSDFQCPFCERLEGSLKTVKEKYGPEKVRIIWKNSPLVMHENARPAALAGATVFALGGSRAFFRFHDAAFANQKNLIDESFATWASDAGVDRAAFQAAYKAKQQDPKIEDDLSSGRKIGVAGTPASFVNGIHVKGARPAPEFEKVIDLELAKADKLLASGVAREKLYVTLSRENVEATPLVPTNDKTVESPLNSEKTIWKVAVGRSPIRGSADALVTIVEFADFECRFSADAEATLRAILKDYDGKVRLAFKHRPVPFHERAIPAANLSVLARREKGDDAFWAVHDSLFANQKALSDDDLVRYGKEVGLDDEAIKAAIHAPPGTALEEDVAVGDALEASGTPILFINGRKLIGAQAPAKIRSVIDEELAKAAARVSSGTAAAEVYGKILEEGRELPPLETKTIGEAPSDTPFKGNADAKVQMHIWSDFECAYCKRVEGTLTQVEKDFGGDVKFFWRDKPLAIHKDAPLAAQAAREAYKQKGSEGFWAYHDDLFRMQGGDFGRSGFENLAEKHALDLAAFKSALDKGVYADAITASAAEGDKYGVTGTPSFIVTYAKTDAGLEGYFLSGALPYAKFKRVLRAAITKANGEGSEIARDDLPIPPPAPDASALPSASSSAPPGSDGSLPPKK